MKKITLITSVVLSALFINTGCQNKNDSTAVAENTNDEKFDNKAEKDADFVVEAASINLMEIKAAELAKSKALTTDAKELAEMMYNAHSKANADLGALAQKKNITVPSSISNAQQDEINNLDKENGLEFDKKYAAMMVDGHESAIKKFEDASTNCNDQDIKTWAANTLPELRHHLDMAKTCKDKLADMKETKSGM